MIHTSRLPSSVVAIHNTPRHSCESDFDILFLEKKKLPEGPTLCFVSQILFWLVAQNF